MDPISNVDRLVFLLRQRLSERNKSGASRAGPTAERGPEPAAVHALAAVEGVDERHLRRALIQNLLSESFGERTVNEAKFQQVVDRVTRRIEQDKEAGKLLHRLVGELKAAAR